MFDITEKLALLFEPLCETVNPRIIILKHGLMEKFGSTRKLTMHGFVNFAIGASSKGHIGANLDTRRIHFYVAVPWFGDIQYMGGATPD